MAEENKYKYYKNRTWAVTMTRRWTTGLWAVLGPTNNLVVPVHHGPSGLVCLGFYIWHGPKHERAGSRRVGPSPSSTCEEVLCTSLGLPNAKALVAARCSTVTQPCCYRTRRPCTDWLFTPRTASRNQEKLALGRVGLGHQAMPLPVPAASTTYFLIPRRTLFSHTNESKVFNFN